MDAALVLTATEFIDEWSVRLGYNDMQHAAAGGITRNCENVVRGVKDKHGCDPLDGWNQHVVGALGESAAAMCLDRYWSIGKMRAPDVWKYQVRSTTNTTNRLMLHKEDNGTDAFILVIGQGPVFRLVGWLYGHEGKKPEYWCDPTKQGRHAFFVPREAMRPMPDRLRARPDLLSAPNSSKKEA